MQFIYSLLILILFFILTLRFAKIITNFDMKNAMKGQQQKGLGEDTFRRYLAVYTDAFRTLNIRSMASISSDLFYHSQVNQVKNLNRLGIKKEITLNTLNNASETTDMNTIGKVAWLTQEIKCQYQEKLIDSVSGRVLDEKSYPSSKFILSMNKNPFRKKSDVLFCSGCGGELQTNGEIFICNSCGASYHSDSYDWVINNAYAEPPALKNTASQMAALMSIIIYAAPVISFISLFGDRFDNAAKVFNAVALLFTIGYFIYAAWYYKAALQMQRFDKLCSMFRVMDRIKFLITKFLNCRFDDRAAMKQFMSGEAYEKWIQTDLNQSGRHIVDYKLSAICKLTDFKVRNGRQTLCLKLPMTLSVFDEKSRKLMKQKCTVAMTIFRNQNTKYQNNFNSEVLYCKGCGMPINQTDEGKCRFCGTEYELADYDWIIESLDTSLYI